MIPSQDLVHGVDFTGINPATGGDHNNLMDLAVPAANHGLVIESQDTALDTPDVPNPLASVDFTKWKNYIWKRRPFASATSLVCQLYTWNDDTVSDPTFLQWSPANPSTADFEAEIAAVSSVANSALASANAALTNASNANVNAGLALTAANAANTTAGNAATLAATALTNAATAQSTADAAATAAAAALTAANARRDVSAVLTPGTSRQMLRTNLAASAVEWFNPKDNYVKIIEKQLTTVGAGDAVIGVNLRALNTEESDTGALAAIGGSKVTMKAGTYKFCIKCPAHTNRPNQAFLIKDSDNSILLQGTSEGRNVGDSAVKSFSIIDGVVTFAADTIVRVDHYWAANGATDSLGKPSGVGPAGQYEVYTVFEAWLLG